MDKSDLINQIAQDCNLETKAAEKALDSILQGMGIEIREGDSVTLNGFGSLQSHKLEVTEYKSWLHRELSDPRETYLDYVVDNFLEIVTVEGPIIQDYAYHIYAVASGIGKIGRLVRNVFDKAIANAIIKGKLEKENRCENETLLKIPGTESVILRTRGERTLEQIPLNEIAQVMVLSGNAGSFNQEMFFRNILHHYDLVRMTNRVCQRFEMAYELSLKISTDSHF